MKLVGYFNGTKTAYMSKDQGKFDFSYLDHYKQNHCFFHALIAGKHDIFYILRVFTEG